MNFTQILGLLRLGESDKTQIKYTINLDHRMTQRYLAWLIDLGLIGGSVDRNKSVSYSITRKGLEVLSKMESLQEMLHRKEVPEILSAPEATRVAIENRFRKSNVT